MYSSIRDNQEQNGYSHQELFYKKIWDIDDVSLFLGLSKKTIYNKVSRRELPYRKPIGGRRLYFVPEEIQNWIEEGMR